MHDSERSTYDGPNTPFNEILESRVSRRGVLQGSLATGAAAFFGGIALDTVMATPAAAAPSLVAFAGIGPSQADDIVVPPGHLVDIILPWGDPVRSGGPAFLPDASNSAADQAEQIGMGHDGMHYFPLGDSPQGNRLGLLAINQEYTVDELLFPDGVADWDAEKTAKSINSHGVSIVGVERKGGHWQFRSTPWNRRITGYTPMTFSGPAAGHRLLQTEADPDGAEVLGTLNNCANGYTPWNSYLTCEENFNGYFWDLGEGERTDEQQALFDAYGVAGTGFDYQWATTDERFRVDLHPNEPNRFGWVVEIDPRDPHSPPVKHTALGRIKHEGATVTIGAGHRIVVYMGDDERFEFIYKFVSSANWRRLRRSGISPFASGVLYVARFHEDGTGSWLPLVHAEGPLTAENGFADQGDVLVKCRLAAELLGATPMDRPEWVAVHPNNGDVYCTLTNNSRRAADGTDAPNPRGPNPWGHIIRWRERHRNAASTAEFSWDLFLLAGPGDGLDGSTIPAAAAFGSPDGLAFDGQGRLWIETDGSQPIDCNDQLLAAAPLTGEIKRFLVGPAGCEVTGITFTPDRRTMFVNIQHPGDAGTAADPTSQSSWPDHDPASRPRPATVAIRRADGRPVGSRDLT